MRKALVASHVNERSCPWGPLQEMAERVVEATPQNYSWLHRIVVNTLACHAGDRGSIPLGVANY